MNKVFEKIIEKLEEEKSNVPVNRLLDDIIKDKPKELGQLIAYNKAIEIVKQAAEKHNNGWIPCSERLPKENGYYYVTQIVKSVSTGKKIAIEKAYVEFSIGEWRRAKHLEVIAWLDIEPYQPKGE